MTCPICELEEASADHVARCEVQEIKVKKMNEGLCYCFENKVLAISHNDPKPEKCIFCQPLDAVSDWQGDLTMDHAHRMGSDNV